MMNIKAIIIVIIVFCAFIYYFYNAEPPKLKKISPQSLIGSFKFKNILIVNVLSPKVPYIINTNIKLVNNSITRDEFDSILKKNNNRIPEHIDLVILLCASYSCKAGYNYYKEIVRKGAQASKIVDYAGGFHEWSLYYLMDNNLFNFVNVNTKRMATSEEIKKLRKDMMHTYLLADELNSKNEIISNLAKHGDYISSCSNSNRRWNRGCLCDDEEKVFLRPASEYKTSRKFSI